LQALPQQLRKEVMIAVPPPLMVQRDEEQVGVFEVFQGGLSRNSRVEHNSLTQRTAETVENGGAQQERLDVLGLLLKDFFHQVVHHELVAACERGDEAGDVLQPLQGNRG